MNDFKLVKNSWVVTIWWCTWGWVDWQCCHLEIWWSMSCISVSLAPDGAVAEAYVLAQRAKSRYPPISISVHARTDHEAWWQPGNVGHRKASKLIVSGLSWCLRWDACRVGICEGEHHLRSCNLQELGMCECILSLWHRRWWTEEWRYGLMVYFRACPQPEMESQVLCPTRWTMATAGFQLALVKVFVWLVGQKTWLDGGSWPLNNGSPCNTSSKKPLRIWMGTGTFLRILPYFPRCV